MPAPINTLKQRLLAGEVLHGIWCALANPYAIQLAATADFDWLLIDGEHAPNDIRSIQAQLAVAGAGGAACVVRLRDSDPAAIKQALDIGAQTLLIPMVDSADQASALVRATRYPPHGFRGVGSALAPASQFGAIGDYLATADAQICLMVQVESVKGMEALDAILQVRDVDGVFIGPADLAADMGYLGQPGHPEVVAAVQDMLRRIRAAGRIAGVLSNAPEFIEGCKAAGANFVGVGADVTVLSQGLRALAARHRRS